MSFVRVLHFFALLGSWAAVGYVLGLPLTRDRSGRGDFLFGYYADYELFVGVPALMVALTLTVSHLLLSRRRRAAALRLLAVVGSSLAALIAFDLGFSLVVSGAIEPDFWLDGSHISRLDNLPDSELGFVRKPDLVWRGAVRGTERTVEYSTDQAGFRNPVGTRGGEIALVGDSYTEAAQVDVEDCFASRLAGLTGRSVWNLGRGAYGPQQELLILERYALGGEPKPAVVVWQLFEGNDLTDAEEFARWQSGDATHKGFWERYRQNSFFAPWLQSTYRSKRGDYAVLRDDEDREHPLALRYRARKNLIEDHRQGWHLTEDALREGARRCREAGVRLVVTFVPVAVRVWRDRLTIDDPELRDIYLPDGFDGDRALADALRELCADLGVTFVDLLPAFERAVQGGGIDGIYIPRDEHLDVRGHALVAEALARALAE